MIIHDNNIKYNSKWELATSLPCLIDAAFKCFKGVLWKSETLLFKQNLISRLITLQKELRTDTYKLSKYVQFKIFIPKERDIFSTALRDRIIQKSLCNNGLYDMLTKGFIYDNCACLKGRGTLFALNRLSTHLHKFYRKHKRNGYILKLDISKFFYKIPHWYIKEIIARKITDAKFQDYCNKLVDSFDINNTGIGLVLGSQISQLFALAVLDPVDHLIKEKFEIKHYIRYMDDLILIHEDKAYLNYVWKEIEKELAKISLSLNPKSHLYPITQNIEFLQTTFNLTNTGKVIRRVPRRKILEEKKKLRKLFNLLKEEKLTIEDIEIHIQSWLSKCLHLNCKNVEREIIIYFNQLKDEMCK